MTHKRGPDAAECQHGRLFHHKRARVRPYTETAAHVAVRVLQTNIFLFKK